MDEQSRKLKELVKAHRGKEEFKIAAGELKYRAIYAGMCPKCGSEKVGDCCMQSWAKITCSECGQNRYVDGGGDE